MNKYDLGIRSNVLTIRIVIDLFRSRTVLYLMMTVVQPFSNSIESFTVSYRKYWCCFGYIHSRPALKLFTFVELIVCFSAIAFSAYGTSVFHGVIKHTLIYSLVINVIYAACIIFAMYGARVENPECLLPYAVVQAFVIVSSVCGFNFAIVQISMLAFIVLNADDDAGDAVVSPVHHYSKNDVYDNKKNGSNYNATNECTVRYAVYRTDFECKALVAYVAIIVYLAVKVWTLFVVSKCYNYFKAKENRKIKQNVNETDTCTISSNKSYNVHQMYEHPLNVFAKTPQSPLAQRQNQIIVQDTPLQRQEKVLSPAPQEIVLRRDEKVSSPTQDIPLRQEEKVLPNIPQGNEIKKEDEKVLSATQVHPLEQSGRSLFENNYDPVVDNGYSFEHDTTYLPHMESADSMSI